METYALAEMVLTGMKIMRGRIVEITTAGEIRVENDPEGLSMPCDFLRTSSAPLPELNPGDWVLYALDETKSHGYVLGLIQKYLPEDEKSYGEPMAATFQKDVQEITFNADEKIELRCGKSSLTMNKDGKIVLKGSHLLSRSSGPNRIKGASVNIN